MPPKEPLWWHVYWWVLVATCLVYAGYAFFMAAVEAGFIPSSVADIRHRNLPLAFVIHALTGGIALLVGPFQFRKRLRMASPGVHRATGRVYVASVIFSSLTGLLITQSFDVSLAARAVLSTGTLLWLCATLIALCMILTGNILAHREWMIRSFALSLFFVTFSLWVPTLAETNIPQSVKYPLAVFLSWSVNLLVAEIWIRKTSVRTGEKMM